MLLKLGKIEKRMTELESALRTHLIESGSIQTQLKFNTWLTGVIAVAIITRAIAELFKR